MRTEVLFLKTLVYIKTVCVVLRRTLSSLSRLWGWRRRNTELFSNMFVHSGMNSTEQVSQRFERSLLVEHSFDFELVVKLLQLHQKPEWRQKQVQFTWNRKWRLCFLLLQRLLVSFSYFLCETRLCFCVFTFTLGEKQRKPQQFLRRSPQLHGELDACFQHQGPLRVGGHAGLPLHNQGAAPQTQTQSQSLSSW